jgi:hypothetical protein
MRASMEQIRWERYPLLAKNSRSFVWLKTQVNLGLATNAIGAEATESAREMLKTPRYCSPQRRTEDAEGAQGGDQDALSSSSLRSLRGLSVSAVKNA